MADQAPYDDSDSDTGDEITGTPRWAYVLGVIVIVLVLAFIILHLTGGGPGGHTP